MPEGPSIVIAKEALMPFKGKKIKSVSGNSKTIDVNSLNNKTIKDFKTWGKHLLICFEDFTIRIHFLMFGSYTVNERKDREERLRLVFKDGEINFYTCSVQLITENLKKVYDFSTDVMNKKWDPLKAKKKIKTHPEGLICDVLLDQEIFSGVGNIIKNEVLYRAKVQPENIVKDIPAKQMNVIIKEAVNYSIDFLKWKKAFILRKQWIVYAKKKCVVCKTPTVKTYAGKGKRRSFYCPNCQRLFKDKKAIA